MPIHAHIKFWIAVFVACFLLVPGYRDSDSMQAFAAQEMAATEAVFGSQLSQRITNQAISIASSLIVSKKVEEISKSDPGLKRAEQFGSKPAVAIMSAFNTYLERIAVELVVMLMRLFVCVVWALVLAPVAIATVIDGLSVRSVKRAEFGAIRPAAFSLASMVIVPLLFAPIIYLVAPFSISPLLIPGWMALIIAPLSWMISNMQPMFGGD